MELGTLYLNNKQLSLDEAIAMARRQFEQAEHLAGRTPTELYLNPAHRPEIGEGKTLMGLNVHYDPALAIDRIRFTTEVVQREVAL